MTRWRSRLLVPLIPVATFAWAVLRSQYRHQASESGDPTQNSAPIEIANKLCLVCGRSIPESARKCTECNSYQSAGARFMHSLNLSALVTLVPVATLAWAFVHDRYQLGKSDIGATLLECQRAEISIFATNRGDRPALIRGASLELQAVNLERGAAPLEFTGPDAADRVVEPTHHRVFHFQSPTIGGASLPVVPPNLDPSNCKILVTVDIINFDQSGKTEKIQCSCPSR